MMTISTPDFCTPHLLRQPTRLAQQSIGLINVILVLIIISACSG